MTTIAASAGAHISPRYPTSACRSTWSASRLVRLDTGSTSDAVLASASTASANGSGGVWVRRASAMTTGVSSTAVVSSDRTAVLSTASRTTSAHSAHRRFRGQPRRQTGRLLEQPGARAHLGDDGQARDEDQDRQGALGRARARRRRGSHPVHDDQHGRERRRRATRATPPHATTSDRVRAPRAGGPSSTASSVGADELARRPGRGSGVVRRLAAAREQVPRQDAARVLGAVRDHRP